ncbi:hypothetical protein BH09ACT8_BH09ACT8_32130 [soil metagenome]
MHSCGAPVEMARLNEEKPVADERLDPSRDMPQTNTEPLRERDTPSPDRDDHPPKETFLD